MMIITIIITLANCHLCGQLANLTTISTVNQDMHTAWVMGV